MTPLPTVALFADLDAVLSTALHQKRDKEAAAAAKARLLKGGGTAAQVADDAILLRAWEELHEWKPVANVALFIEQECTGCGDFQYFNQGLFKREEPRVGGHSRRWEPTDEQDPRLPREVMLQYRAVNFCGECAVGAGFSFARSYYENEDPVGKLAACDAAIEEGKVVELPVDHANPLMLVEETPWPTEWEQVS